MSIPIQVTRCSIYNEFTKAQQREYFGLTEKKTLHHIDTLYYSVSLNEPKDVINLQRDGKLPDKLTHFLDTLQEMKASLRSDPSVAIDIGDLQYSFKSFSIYEYCVSCDECFDIFISRYLPNAETPRIVVQLRSRYLVLEGVFKAVEESFLRLCRFLSPFGLFPVSVRENRIDYAFHTNLIQNPYRFFSDGCLVRHLKSNLRTLAKYGKIIDSGIELETLSLGNRKSNNIYFRGYNKSQEVIRQNYKSFFFQRWFDNGLISAFDQYVYETAFRMKSYRSGLLVGRLKWYLEFGTNDELKEQFRKLLESCYVNSDNNTYLEKQLRNVIPEPTLIFNIEYQVKRKFFVSCSEWIGSHQDALDFDDYTAASLPPMSEGTYHPLLRNLFTLLSLSPEIIDYLTSYGNVVSFAKDRSMSWKDFKESDEPYMAWWGLLRSTKIDYASSAILDLYRSYDMRMSIDRTQRNVQGQIARLAILNRNSVEDRSFVEDMADVLCTLNDNDVQAFVINSNAFINERGEMIGDLKRYDPKDYPVIRRRRSRQMKSIIKNTEP